MPIAFPQKPLGHPTTWAKNLVKAPLGFVSAPNIRNPGVNFARAFALCNIDQRPQPLTDARLIKQTKGLMNWTSTAPASHRYATTIGIGLGS